ncbi:MobQ family relaxase [Xanthomonas rydalmerensis]|uniref:MobQ family relaxase n=1 Tax=Xanthomonas rydalmerensis TaxID=3046274 RepID=A0ABZ0JJC8_9XANT|nr:MobQ family relaxase [Xanthomonas sp. DM-2023]WOS39909.1 MobQ family relaxase [Xanthomonas sp. DM-2023]WOS44093.1 MobQ family relaxase [Xanthomonas sp. DM-2023]WOS48273.1 MobQ family relaxase [Xanthomonas sp. DM-2023]WOS52452.1 MobQ family relaxase [Xanthomonas sp. DM-2023]WOS56636.1 MobQ family relaxase [Xanthomonas sp. DM-2023]
MAIFHTSIKIFSRSRGQSALAAAAYRGGLLIADLLTGQQHDYRRRSGVVQSFCLAPPDAPEWAFDPQELWAIAEAAERRKDSTVAREFEVSLPHELSDEQRAQLAFVIADALVDRYGFAVQASLHSPRTPDGLNHHVHILATTRRIGPEGFGDKTRELDVGPSGKAQVQWIREMIATMTNAHLEAAGITSTIDHRSLAEQARSAMERGDDLAAAALSREPTQHLGKSAAALARKGVATDRASKNEQIAEDNKEHYEYLVRKAGLAGKPAPSPTQEEAPARGGRILNSDTAGLPAGLEMRGVSGVRLQHLLLSSHGLPEQQAPVSLAERIVDALRDLEEIARARADLAMERTRDALSWAQRQLSLQGETIELRQWITKAVIQVRALKCLIINRARRLLNVKSATKLHHIAEQEWERFNSDYPLDSTVYSRPEWTQRRGRRLSVLEKRTAELKLAQERAAEQELSLIDSEIAKKAELLKAMPYPPQGQVLKPVAPQSLESDASAPRPRVPRGPTLH